jgi:small-conductance mechanosensitive channel
MDELKKIFSYSETLVLFVVIAAATIVTAILLGKFLQKEINEKARDHHVDTTGFVFLKHIMVSTVYCLGFGWALLSLPITHTFAHSLLAGAGATTLILGFASQQIFTNLLSGVFLVIKRPFKINDNIEFRGSIGKVIEINLSSILIQDDIGDITIIPSSLILNDKIKIISEKTNDI